MGRTQLSIASEDQVELGSALTLGLVVGVYQMPSHLIDAGPAIDQAGTSHSLTDVLGD